MLDKGSSQEEFSAAAERIASLAQEFENLPYPHLRDKAADLLQAVDALHRGPLERLVCLLKETGHEGVLDRLSEDPLVHQLLVLYDLAPGDDRTQVEAALYSFGQYAHAHGGAIEVEDIADGVVKVRVSGACLACSRSTTSLRRGIEEAIRQEYPDFNSLEITGEPSETAGPVTDVGCSSCS